MPQAGTIWTQENGLDLIVEWRISNFFTLSKENGTGYISPLFSSDHAIWYLQIFPNGSKPVQEMVRNGRVPCGSIGRVDLQLLKDSSGRHSSGHVDVRLCKFYDYCSIRQSFSLSLKTAKGKKYNEQNGTKDFDESYYHEFSRLIPRSELTMRSSELVPEGVLTVVCTMKSSPSTESESNSGSAEYYVSDSDSAERSSDFDSGECCLKCSNCLDIVKKQKKLLEELENAKKRSEGAEFLCEDYKKVLLGGRHHDLILKVGDKELRAHRDILRARSKVFESMLDHDMKEKSTGIIDVPDCDPDAMELLLSYVYCDKIDALDHSNMLELYYVADKYEMVELKRECCNFIKKSLCLTNICNVIQLALNHSDSDLLEYATGYFEENVLDILQTVEWQSFLKENSTVGNELLIKSIKKLKNA